MNRQPMLGGNGFAVSRNLDPNLVRVESLKALGRETRKHPPSQIRKLQASIEQFGFVLPVVIDVDSRVIAGWGLAVAAKRLGLTQVPAVTIADLDEAKLRMLRLALNRLGEDSGWDVDALKLEFSDILEISSEIDLRISGFEMGEIDVTFEGSGNDEEDNLPALNETSTPVTQLGDLWLLGEHRILCADALMCESYARLLGDERAQMVFTDPPWNIPIAGHVSGLGAIKHSDFAMGCGEMSAVGRGVRGLPAHGARPCRHVFGRWLDPFRVHALGENPGASRRHRGSLLRHQEPLRLEQDKCRHGITVPVAARTRICVQEGNRATYQLCRARPLRPEQIERLGIWRPECPQWHIQKQAVGAPDGQARRARGRRDSGLFQPQWNHPRFVRGRRHNLDRRREDGTQSPLDRDRSALRRRHDQALAECHG